MRTRLVHVSLLQFFFLPNKITINRPRVPRLENRDDSNPGIKVKRTLKYEKRLKDSHKKQGKPISVVSARRPIDSMRESQPAFNGM